MQGRKEFIESFELLSPAFAKPFSVSCHPKPATVHKSTDEQMTRQANASAKSKELQPTALSQSFAAHLLLPQPHPSPPTTQTGIKETFHLNKSFCKFVGFNLIIY